MPNRSYNRSAARERQIQKELQAQGWFAVRSSGSHGRADVVAIRQALDCPCSHHYEVRFIQVKTGRGIKEKRVETRMEPSPNGMLEIEYMFFPARGRKKEKGESQN